MSRISLLIFTAIQEVADMVISHNVPIRRIGGKKLKLSMRCCGPRVP